MRNARRNKTKTELHTASSPFYQSHVNRTFVEGLGSRDRIDAATQQRNAGNWAAAYCGENNKDVSSFVVRRLAGKSKNAEKSHSTARALLSIASNEHPHHQQVEASRTRSDLVTEACFGASSGRDLSRGPSDMLQAVVKE
jgi:hypothetical protein